MLVSVFTQRKGVTEWSTGQREWITALAKITPLKSARIQTVSGKESLLNRQIRDLIFFPLSNIKKKNGLGMLDGTFL